MEIWEEQFRYRGRFKYLLRFFAMLTSSMFRPWGIGRGAEYDECVL